MPESRLLSSGVVSRFRLPCCGVNVVLSVFNDAFASLLGVLSVREADQSRKARRWVTGQIWKLTGAGRVRFSSRFCNRSMSIKFPWKWVDNDDGSALRGRKTILDVIEKSKVRKFVGVGCQ